MRWAKTRWGIGLTCIALAAVGCRPSTIAEAESKGDIAWLDENGTPDAVAAIGRLADTKPKAVTALEARSGFDVQAFKAAWEAVLRGASWGPQMLRGGLGDPARADLAASAMTRRDPHLAGYVQELESALVRLSATLQNFNVASTLASMGTTAHAAVVRRLQDASTRGAMCRGIASKDADPDARKALLAVPVAARDADACVDAVVRIASDDPQTLGWLADQGEPGLLGAASKTDTLSCANLHVLWARVLTARPAEVHSALTVPLGYAVKRCAAEMDGVLADAIVHVPAARPLVVQAIDPFTGYGNALKATCAALPGVASGGDSALVRERAADALAHACKAPG